MSIDTKALREPAPANNLPTWDVCRLIIENAEFARRAERGLEGAVLDTGPHPEPTALHRFIHEYDDADPYRSAWFLHRLEQVLSEVTAYRLAALEAALSAVLTDLRERADTDSDGRRVLGIGQGVLHQAEKALAGGAA